MLHKLGAATAEPAAPVAALAAGVHQLAEWAPPPVWLAPLKAALAGPALQASLARQLAPPAGAAAPAIAGVPALLAADAPRSAHVLAMRAAAAVSTGTPLRAV